MYICNLQFGPAAQSYGRIVMWYKYDVKCENDIMIYSNQITLLQINVQYVQKVVSGSQSPAVSAGDLDME